MSRATVRTRTPIPGMTFESQLKNDTAGLASELPVPLSVRQAIQEIYISYGDRVSVSGKGKSLLKFGRNPAIGTSYETIQAEGGDETYVTDNVIDKMSSSASGDTNRILIEGCTIDADNHFTNVVQETKLVGRTETDIPIPLARVTRLINISSSDFLGDVYIYEDDTVTNGVPQTAANIHMQVVSGNQSEKCSTTMSNSEYFIITGLMGHCFDKNSEIVEYLLEMREVGSFLRVFRRVFSFAGSEGQSTAIPIDPPIIVPKNFDVRMRAACAASGDVGGNMVGHLAVVV